MIPWTLLLILYRQVICQSRQEIKLIILKKKTIILSLCRLLSGSSWPRRLKVKRDILITIMIIIVTFVFNIHMTRWSKSGAGL